MSSGVGQHASVRGWRAIVVVFGLAAGLTQGSAAGAASRRPAIPGGFTVSPGSVLVGDTAFPHPGSALAR
jgi:hypothetical protein